MSKKPLKNNNNVHTIPFNGEWANKQGGEIISTHRLKSEAVSGGRDVAIEKKSEHTIHNRNGKISEKNSYGNDPNPPKDSK